MIEAELRQHKARGDQYCTHASTDIDALIAEVKRLQKILDTASWMPRWKALEELAKVVGEIAAHEDWGLTITHCSSRKIRIAELLKEVEDGDQA